MNSPALLMLASVLISMSRSACNEPEAHMARQGTSPSADTAALFAAVCKVGEHGGDGTLIASDWVLTAGHVAEGMFRRTSGDLHVLFDNGDAYAVHRVFLHPDFEPMGPYDIALLQLDGAVKGIAPVAICMGSDELHQLIILAGHGDKRLPDGTWIKDGHLRSSTNIVDEVNNTHLIFDYDAPGGDATAHEGTSGPGDSGGPAFLGTAKGYAVAGVSSMGEPGTDGPCSYGAREYFVRVSRFQDWIKTVMADPEHHQTLSTDMPVAEEVQAVVNGQGSAALGGTKQERAARTILDALASASEATLVEAIATTYDPAILEKREAQQIAGNMPALVRELSGAHLLEVLSSASDKISLKLENKDRRYVLDIFFGAAGTIEQMAFGGLQ